MRAASISLMPCFSIRRRRCAFSWPSVMARAYPRVCGATCQEVALAGMGEGLSPRVRGNPSRHRYFVSRSGPIPACAGQPFFALEAPKGLGAYPRVCGATPEFVVVLEAFVGPIPACAGQPVPCELTRQVPRAYPRVCGATRQLKYANYYGPGLSPRVRGNRRGDLAYLRTWGPIPACAGQPFSYRHADASKRAYPRVCGATGLATRVSA